MTIKILERGIRSMSLRKSIVFIKCLSVFLLITLVHDTLQARIVGVCQVSNENTPLLKVIERGPSPKIECVGKDPFCGMDPTGELDEKKAQIQSAWDVCVQAEACCRPKRKRMYFTDGCKGKPSLTYEQVVEKFFSLQEEKLDPSCAKNPKIFQNMGSLIHEQRELCGRHLQGCHILYNKVSKALIKSPQLSEVKKQAEINGKALNDRYIKCVGEFKASVKECEARRNSGGD